MVRRNLYSDSRAQGGGEVFEELARGAGFQLERIVSRGHATPPDQWLEQDRAEWVVLLAGAARLVFEDNSEPVHMGPGDWLLIAAHQRHRVEWTAPNEDTVWLALHYRYASA